MEPNVKSVWVGLCLTPASRSIFCLAKAFSSPEEIFDADDESIIDALGSHRGDIRRLLRRDLSEAARTVSYCASHGISIVTWFDEDYPAQLREIEKPPAVLFLTGDRTLLGSFRTVGVVGTRTPSEYAAKMTFEITSDLARADAVVVSGMAYGIDGIAAAGALSSGGKTIAVVGCGLDLTYPAKHGKLRREIERSGLVISEYPPGSPPERYHFPERNRIISGLSLGVFVAEGTLQSGAMITADCAERQGKTLFALPGRLDSPFAEGPVKLMREGACPVACADDILAKLERENPGTFDLSLLLVDRSVSDYDAAVKRYGVSLAPAKGGYAHPSERVKTTDTEPKTVPLTDLFALSEEERTVYDALQSPLTADELSRCGIDPPTVLAALTTLEIRGIVRSLPGGRYERAN